MTIILHMKITLWPVYQRCLITMLNMRPQVREVTEVLGIAYWSTARKSLILWGKRPSLTDFRFIDTHRTAIA